MNYNLISEFWAILIFHYLNIYNKEVHITHLENLQPYLTNNFRHLLNCVGFCVQKARNRKFFTLFSVSFTVISFEFNTKPKYSIIWHGSKTDFTGWTKNPHFIDKFTVFITFYLHSSILLPKSKESSIYDVFINPGFRKCEKRGF